VKGCLLRAAGRCRREYLPTNPLEDEDDDEDENDVPHAWRPKGVRAQRDRESRSRLIVSRIHYAVVPVTSQSAGIAIDDNRHNRFSWRRCV
jgi:hypothetical protein